MGDGRKHGLWRVAEDRWSAVVDAASTDVASPTSGTKPVQRELESGSQERVSGLASEPPRSSTPANASDMWLRTCADDIPTFDLDDSVPEARVFIAPMIVPLFVASDEPNDETSASDRVALADSLRPTALPLEELEEEDPARRRAAPPRPLVLGFALACVVVLGIVGAVVAGSSRGLVRTATASSAPPEPVNLSRTPVGSSSAPATPASR